MRIGVDVGGTFTDVVAIDDERCTAVVLKVPTTPHAPQAAVLDAVQSTRQDGVAVSWIGHSTTIATNALLGQVGLELARVVLVTTDGFRDLIEIGRQNRSRIYDLFAERPRPLAARDDRLTVRERIDARGEIVEPLDETSLAETIAAIRERKPDAVAVCLLNAYVNGAHERAVANAVRERGGVQYVVTSSGVDPEYREYERFSTAVVSAALGPLVTRYLEALQGGLRERGLSAPVYVMRSDGGLSEASAAALLPAALIESGPASGVIAAAAIAREHGVERALSFDMGGTTAKAGAIAGGRPEVVTEYEAAGATHSGRQIKGSGYPVRYPFVDLSEVSAGGGTIAWIDDARRLRVGPLSAGADPGPACYGRSDRATVTDANVVLGRLHQTHLLGGAFPIDARRSYDAVAALGDQLGFGVEQTAAGVVTLVDAEMAKALRIVTVERGLDARDFTMIAFGGGGPLHACAVASELGIRWILVPLRPGMLSAQGLLVADLSSVHVHPLLRETRDITEEEAEAIFLRLEELGREDLARQGADAGAIRFRRTYAARYCGQSFELQVEHDAALLEVERRFHALHRTRYGYAVEGDAVELVSARSTAAAPRCAAVAASSGGAKPKSRQKVSRRLWLDADFVEAPVFNRDDLESNTEIAGPAVVEQYDCTTYVAPGWTALVLHDGTLALGALGKTNSDGSDNV